VELVVLRLVLEHLDRDLGDDAERALVADHHVADVRAGRAARHGLDATDRAAGEDRLEPDDHVLDRTVERRELPDRTGRDEAAVLGERLGLRRVAGGEALQTEFVLEALERHARLHRHLHVLRVDVEHGVHPRAVEHDGVDHARLEAALGAGATGARDDVDQVVVREGEDRGDVLGGLGVHDGDRDGRVVDPVHGLVLLEPVDAGVLQVLVVRVDLLGSDDLGEAREDLGAVEGGDRVDHAEGCLSLVWFGALVG